MVQSAPAQAGPQQLEAFLDRFYTSWFARDGGAIKTLVEPVDELVVWGTEVTKRIVGPADAEEIGSYVESCPCWTSLRPTLRVTHLRDNLAIVIDEIEGCWAEQGQQGTIPFRLTLVLDRTEDGFRAVHVHLSSPTD